MSALAANSPVALPLSLPKDGLREDQVLEEELLSLFDLLRLRLLRYAVSFGISIADGEDIVQETFLALFHHLKHGRSRDNLCGWLFRVSHNLALKKREKMTREVGGLTLEEAEKSDPDPNPEECMLVSERHIRLQAVLRALPFGDQLCLRLRAEGLRYREIAEITGISLGSVSASLNRSLARLQEADRR
jgi:RNA polymerase sigma-70 factor (ECF subfamily)